MLDFLIISTKSPKKDQVLIFPKFVIKKSEDLMIRGGDFYAIWNDNEKLWSTNEHDVTKLVDAELKAYYEKIKDSYDCKVSVCYMWDSDSGSIDSWHKYCQRQMRDSYEPLDENIVFDNTEVSKSDYVSKKLPYSIENISTPAYDKLISTLYEDSEREKIEWSIGSIVAGYSKHIQKFVVLYGSAGTGKSTILNIIQQLFEGYYSVFDAKALGSSSNSFALEAFRNNPLVAIQHDGDLSRIEDNTRLNSLVSHELMTVNEKFKASYSNRFNAFLFMGTNKPVKITDAKSGLIRRLIDVSPSGNKVSSSEYINLVNQVKFELGGIANKCLKSFVSNKHKYDNYIPKNMLGASNDFYNFVMDSGIIFAKEDGITLKSAWEMYKEYCTETNMLYPMAQRAFKEELKNYFREFKERHVLNDGTRVRNYYKDLIVEKFDSSLNEEPEELISWCDLSKFKKRTSLLDKYCSEYPAQYANDNETPSYKWDDVTTKLSDIDTSKIHYIKPDIQHIVIDFDIKDNDGNKDIDLCLLEASKWSPTYAEFSKSGNGLHLHYLYAGDVTKLKNEFDKNIEIKKFVGGSSLRRRLSKCNDLDIAHISSGLPLKKEDNKIVNFEGFKEEKNLRRFIERNLRKEIHSATKPSIDFIHKGLEDCYNSDLVYDVTDMYSRILTFAAQSSNQADACLKKIATMKFKSEDITIDISDDDNNDKPFVFFDIEVFPNLLLICWKKLGVDKINVMINPSTSEVESLCRMRLIGFNNRRYDNSILYAGLLGYTNEEIYKTSSRIIGGDNSAIFRESYKISYTDIYDFSSAKNKKSLKKWEIELGLKHQELDIPFDEPVPDELIAKVVEYCKNDVIATETVFMHLQGDWSARKILADIAGKTPNDSTNALSTAIIFGRERDTSNHLRYRDLSEPVMSIDDDLRIFLNKYVPKMLEQTHGEANSILPYFDGYRFEFGKSYYKGIEVGEGGLVLAIPGMYYNVALLDIVSMHPSSAIAEMLFGMKYTTAFKDILEARVAIKTKNWELARKLLDGKLSPYVDKILSDEISAKDLSDALKTAVNSVYGLTFARFSNVFKDKRNKDNIVAKRGALFMVDLYKELERMGIQVVHVKTDSVKIPNATPEIINYIIKFGEKYGYEFEHEVTYEKMCLVNDAVYIAKEENGHWSAVGAQFAVPYVYKTLFSKEDITLKDYCETKSVKQGVIYLMDDEDKRFVGKTGSFIATKNGRVMNRVMNDKNYAVTGTKGYLWTEDVMLKDINDIDHNYYDGLVSKARDKISEYGDVDGFVAG